MTILKNGNSGLTRSIVCLVLIAFTAGCTTMRPVYGTDATSYATQIEVGDKIEITRNDLTTVQFKVTDISDEGISGDGTFVAYSDIQQVQTVRIKTGATIALVVLGVLAIAGAGAASAGGLGLEGFTLY
jgi:protein involved in polysaccharide export with SLBB domain